MWLYGQHELTRLAKPESDDTKTFELQQALK